MTLDSAWGSDGCEASPRLPTGLCGSRIRTDDSFYVLCAAASLLDDRLAADGHGGAGASHAHQMEALQTDEQITPITTIKRHRAAAGRVRHRPRSLKIAGVVIDELEKTPRAAWCPWPELMEQDSTGGWHLCEHPERLPLQFAITAHKN